MFGGGAGMGGIGSMLGPMIGGAAGSMFQPGTKAKDEATAVMMQRNAGWDDFLQAVQSNTQMRQLMDERKYMQPDMMQNILSGLATPMM